jgi:hypothetical protein
LELNEKLRHLSDQQIEDLIRKYEDKNIKLIDLINEYKLDVKPAGLLKILPPVTTKILCIYCGHDMYQEREGRSSYSYEKTKFCFNCGHKEYSDSWYIAQECECENCLAYRTRLIQDKKNQIKNLYGKEQQKRDFSEISFRNQVDLIYVLLNNPQDNTFVITPSHLIFKHKKEWIRKLNRLLDTNVLTISPNSDVNAFEDEDFPHTAIIEKVTYNVNVYFTNDTIKQIDNNVYFKEKVKPEELLSVLKEYIYTDAIRNFTKFLEERNLKLNITENANSLFINLLDKVSYTQLVNLCYHVAAYFSDKVLTKKMKKDVACNSVLLNVSKFYDNTINSGWVLNNNDYGHAGEELKYYVERILGKKLKLLTMVLSVEILEEAENIERNYDMDTKKFY